MTTLWRGNSQGADEDVREEIAFYLDERARELVALGIDPEEARRQARQAFGDVDEVVARVRRIDRGRSWEEGMRTVGDGISRNVRYAIRGLLRSPGFATVAVLTLGLGIGAVTAIFSVVNASLLRALPFDDGEEIVFLQGAYDAPEGPAIRGASPPEARDWEEMSHSFTEVSVAGGTSFTLTSDGPAEVVPGERVDEGYFELFRIDAVLGRTFTDEEYRVPGTHFVALISHDLWTRRYGSDPAVIGRTIELGSQPWTVVGVLPDGFRGTTLNADLFVPLATLGEETLASRGDRFLGVVARLAPGVTLGDAQADMDQVAARLEAAYPDEHEDRIALVTPAREVYLGSTRTLMLVILGAAGLLLLVAGANIVNLLLVRATAREAEVVVRRAIGASRRRLLVQFVTEGLVLSAAGAAVGLLLGIWGARALTAAMPNALLPAYVQVRPDFAVFLFVTATMTLLGVGAGLAPGVLAAGGRVAGSLRSQGRTSRAGTSRLQGAFVISEVALALLLLVGAGLMTRSLSAQLGVDPGYDHDALYGFQLFLPQERYTRDELRPSVDELVARLEEEPEVGAATLMSDIPLRSGYSATYLWLAEATQDEDRIRFYVHRVGPDWFTTMGTPMVRGRPIDATDSNEELEVAVISEALADRFFPGEDPIGRTIFLGSRQGDGHTIVGVAADVRYRDLTTDIRGGYDDPDVYVPWERYPNRSLGIVLRPRAGDAVGLDPVVRRIVADYDPLLAVTNNGPLADDLRGETAQARFGFLLLTTFSGLAVILAIVGLYGVLAFAVGRRRREIAVRMALGAESSRVRTMVVRQGMRLIAGGLVLGLGAALVAGRTLDTFLFGVEPVDPVTYMAVVAVMAGAGALAAWIPATRATRTDPQRALREE